MNSVPSSIYQNKTEDYTYIHTYIHIYIHTHTHTHFNIRGQIIQTVKYADDLVLMAKEETVLRA
jgi:hypothetical protein